MATDPALDERISRLEGEAKTAREAGESPVLIKLALIEANLARQDKTLSQIAVAVNGNGQPGLLEQVRALKADKDRRAKFTAGLIASLVATLVPMLIGGLVWLIRLSK